MNPAMLNYLQQQDNQSVAPDMGAQAQPPYNPFDIGIRKAIESARESLGMTEKQQDKALRRSMLSLAGAINQEPKQRGFFNNVGVAARALAPAVTSYDQSEEAALAQNNALANQILSYKAADETRQAQEEDRSWRRQFSESQLAEQKRYHDMMSADRKAMSTTRNSGLGSFGSTSISNTDFSPITSKAEVTAYAKDQKSFGIALKEAVNIEKKYEKLLEDYKDNLVSPAGPVGGIVNPAKDLFSIISSNKNLRQERTDREDLESEIGEFKAGLERSLKGGVLGPKVLEYFDKAGIYPTITDTPETFQTKMERIREKISELYESADLSLKYGVRVNAFNLDEFKNHISPKQEETESDLEPAVGTESDYVRVRSPSGREEEIHIDDLPKALEMNFTRVE
jgi:hypothetical protein